jgi:RHS repeat-associated protein
MTRSVVADGRTFLYMYTAADERIVAVESLSDGGQLVTWTPRGFGNELLSVWNGETWKEDEIWRGSSLVGLLTPAGKRHYSLDHLGSPRVVTNDSGTLIGTQKFSPFGSGGAVDSGALQFTGHERDRANLGGGTVNLPDYAHARLLDTDGGRFLSVDPSRDSAEFGRPQSWNRYSYALNNPLKYVDPDGRDWEFARALTGRYERTVAHLRRATELVQSARIIRPAPEIKLAAAGIKFGPATVLGKIALAGKYDRPTQTGQVTIAGTFTLGTTTVGGEVGVKATKTHDGLDFQPHGDKKVEVGGATTGSGEATLTIGFKGVGAELGVNYDKVGDAILEVGRGVSAAVVNDATSHEQQIEDERKNPPQ